MKTEIELEQDTFKKTEELKTITMKRYKQDGKMKRIEKAEKELLKKLKN